MSAVRFEKGSDLLTSWVEGSGILVTREPGEAH